ncbi:MAG: putative lipid II flippase FtsW [Solirubrobacteraceae bacterium]
MQARSARRRTTRRVAPPLEHRILLTATLCLIAFGAVMVYSASSPDGVINGGGYGITDFVHYLVAAVLGLTAMRLFEQYGLSWFNETNVRLLLYVTFGLMLAVLVPGIGRDVNGARRWFAFGPLEFQPSELMKLSLVLYVSRYLADHPKRLNLPFRAALAPIAVVLAPACGLMVLEPDLGTTLLVVFTIVSLLVAAGIPFGHLARIVLVVIGLVAVMAVLRPYQLGRLTSFLHPFSVASSSGWQAVQGQMAVGSGGLSGVGLGQSVAKVQWLPEAQTDFILAVVGEELGLIGILAVVTLYGMIAYAGLRTARRAATRYTKLLAAGLTSLILCQGILNIFVVLGIAPLTGVPLPFISYAPTSLIVMLMCVGLLLAIAKPAARELRLVDTGDIRVSRAVAYDSAEDPDRHRRYGGAHRSGVGSRRAFER